MTVLRHLNSDSIFFTDRIKLLCQFTDRQGWGRPVSLIKPWVLRSYRIVDTCVTVAKHTERRSSGLYA